MSCALCSRTRGPLQERHFAALGEELLALDRRDSHVVPQLMRLQPRSPLALAKALATAQTDLILHVVLHSYEELALESLREGDGVGSAGATRRSAEGAAARFAPFYAFLKDPPEAPPRGLVREQAYDTWHAFVHGMVVPLPNVALVHFNKRLCA
jgi:Vps16, C-terminal region